MECEFPVVSSYSDWLINTARSIGITFNGEATPNTEIYAWVQLTNIELTLWEIETIKSLSNTYLIALDKYEGDKAINEPPFMSAEGLKLERRKYAQTRKAQMTRK